MYMIPENLTDENVITVKDASEVMQLPPWNSPDISFFFRTTNSSGVLMHQSPEGGSSFFTVILKKCRFNYFSSRKYSSNTFYLLKSYFSFFCLITLRVCVYKLITFTLKNYFLLPNISLVYISVTIEWLYLLINSINKMLI